MNTSLSRRNRAGFTLVELMTSIAILGLVSLVIAQMLSSTAQITVVNAKHADANSQARMVFDRMQADFARMVKRSDVDYLFYKGAVGSTGGPNDTIFFYSEAASYFPNLSTYSFFSSVMPAATPYAYKNSVSLVGYRVNTNSALPNFAEMERVGRPLTWDTAPTYTANGSALPATVVFLTYPYPPATTTQLSSNSSPFCANPVGPAAYSTAVFSSTLAGAFSNQGATPTLVGTEAKNFNDGGADSFNGSFYRPIGTQVFRLEISFQLRDGTESAISVMAPTSANNLPTSNLAAVLPPAASNDSTSTGGSYAFGSRWYDTKNQIGYICLDPSVNAAVWHEIGLQDISAIVVTIAVMDNQGLVLLRNRGLLSSTTKGIPALQQQLVDGTSSAVAQTWQTALTPVGGVSPVSTATGIPQSIVSQIRVYQRFFYINNL